MCIGRLPHDNGGYCMSNNDSRIPEQGAGWGVVGRAGTRTYVARATTLLKIDSAGNHTCWESYIRHVE